MGSFQNAIGMLGKGAEHTNSPCSPTTARPASSKTSTFIPSPRDWISPRQTGSIGFPSAKQEMRSVPPLMLLKRASAFTCS